MKTYVMLAPGFEIAEATVPIDIMRRAGIDVQIVSITPFNDVEASNGVVVVADALLEDTDLSDGDLIFLPGGMPGATNLSDCEPLRESILQYNAAGKWLAAICAAPLVYGRLAYSTARMQRAILASNTSLKAPIASRRQSFATRTSSLAVVQALLLPLDTPSLQP